MFNFTAGMVVVLSGLLGLVIILTESPKQIGSKIPLAVFFILIMIIGIFIEIKMKEEEQTYGEFGEGKREIV